MAFEAVCDMCSRPIKAVGDIVEVAREMQVPNVVDTVCSKCNKKIINKVHALATYYNNELMKDMRDFLYDAAAKPVDN